MVVGVAPDRRLTAMGAAPVVLLGARPKAPNHTMLGGDEELISRSIIAIRLLVLACARPRQSLWRLPSPAARYMRAAVVYTRFEKLFRSLDIHEL